MYEGLKKIWKALASWWKGMSTSPVNEEEPFNPVLKKPNPPKGKLIYDWSGEHSKKCRCFSCKKTGYIKI
jgi:hypothetical protein